MRTISCRDMLRTIGAGTASLILAACTLGQVSPGSQACTLVACGPSLEVALVGEHVPTDFAMSVRSPQGDIVNIRCTEGNAEFDPPEAARWVPSCPPGAVTLQEFAPEQLTVTVRWSEGEAVQEIKPVYSEHQPNGPRCEPTCRAARVEIRIPQVGVYGDPSTWPTYKDQAHRFHLRYPPALQLESAAQVNGNGVVYVGDQIRIQTSQSDPLVCRGDCPMIESTEALVIAGREARRVRGYIGSVGGNIPQYFLLYVFHLGEGFASFALYAESRDAELKEPSSITPLSQADVDLFESMMETLRFDG